MHTVTRSWLFPSSIDTESTEDEDEEQEDNKTVLEDC